ncbi:hypothetical protein JHK85_007497 [Glycine max]|nr:hypothetical protein JHK85_007497 [Glycine max]
MKMCCKKIVDVRKVFDEMPRRTVASWNSVMTTIVSLGDGIVIKDHERKTKTHGGGGPNQGYVRAMDPIKKGGNPHFASLMRHFCSNSYSQPLGDSSSCYADAS